jgi:hypothetical protein
MYAAYARLSMNMRRRWAVLLRQTIPFQMGMRTKGYNQRITTNGSFVNISVTFPRISRFRLEMLRQWTRHLAEQRRQQADIKKLEETGQ